MADQTARLLEGLKAMALEASAAYDHAGESRARSLMHAAVDRRSEAASRPVRWREHGLRLVRRNARLGGAVAATLATVAAVVGVLGWSAPAGSPLHDVRLARESVALHLPGADSSTLVLGFAEDRLADAQAGRNPQSSLVEAANLLATCRGSLPSDHGDALWQRWTRDQAELVDLQARLAPPPGSATQPSPSPAPKSPSPAAAGTHGGAGNAGPASSATSSEASGDAGEDGRATASSSASSRASTSEESERPEDAHPGGGSSASSSSTTQSTSSDEGRGRGGDDLSARSTTSTTSTTSSSEDGRGR
jgi:hypothetical protein